MKNPAMHAQVGHHGEPHLFVCLSQGPYAPFEPAE